MYVRMPGCLYVYHVHASAPGSLLTGSCVIMWVLGIESGYSGRAAHDFNY